MNETKIPWTQGIVDTRQCKPILFSPPMVRAIQAGRKTQTRRLNGLRAVNEDPDLWHLCGRRAGMGRDQMLMMHGDSNSERWGEKYLRCPYGSPGGQLWVRESYISDSCGGLMGYVADGYKITEPWERFHPSIHMPRRVNRIILRVVSVRIERLQSVAWPDAIHEGVREHRYPACGDHPGLVGYVTGADGEYGAAHTKPQDAFRNLWDSLNARRGYGWNRNPWVWVVTFRVAEIRQFPQLDEDAR